MKFIYETAKFMECSPNGFDVHGLLLTFMKKNHEVHKQKA